LTAFVALKLASGSQYSVTWF